MSHESVIRLDKAFDVPAAQLIERILAAMSAGDRLRIDFSQVRSFEDFGIGVLAQVLQNNDGVSVRLEGLRLHQLRLLRYFGIDEVAFRPEAVQSITRPAS